MSNFAVTLLAEIALHRRRRQLSAFDTRLLGKRQLRFDHLLEFTMLEQCFGAIEIATDHQHPSLHITPEIGDLTHEIFFDAKIDVRDNKRRHSFVAASLTLPDGILGQISKGIDYSPISLARKLAVILRRLWCGGTSFRWSTQKVSG